jgi:hypothetical protein
MSCEQINSILDFTPAEKLPSEARQAVERHLASCRACRDTWAAYREIAAAPVPRMPPQLRARIAAAIAERSAEPRRPRGWIGFGCVVVVAAAVGATVVVQRADRSPERPATVESLVPQAAPAVSTPSELTPVSADRIAAASSVEPSDAGGGAAANAAIRPLDAQSIVVLTVPDPSVDAHVAAELAHCRAEVVRALRAVNGLNVIADVRVAAFAAAGLPEEQIARELGAGNVLVLKTMNRQASCNVMQRDAHTGEQRGMAAMVFVGPEWTADAWRSFAAMVADTVENATLKEQSTVIAEAHATALNTALADDERVKALFDLFDETAPVPGAFDSAVVAAAVEIGSSSRDAQARETAWAVLRGIDDSYVIQPLLYALANDREENVRREAALTLGYFVELPGVRDALARAAANDPSPEVAVSCCAPTVREAARYALLSEEERRALAVQTVLDESLPAEQRLRPFNSSFDGRDIPLVDDAAARAVFDIGARSANPAIRSSAWQLLGAVRNADFKPLLLEDLASHPADNVRLGAAFALAHYVADPAVRAALERARNDPSRDVQREARQALAGEE